jgi:hypothetical protein
MLQPFSYRCLHGTFSTFDTSEIAIVVQHPVHDPQERDVARLAMCALEASKMGFIGPPYPYQC